MDYILGNTEEFQLNDPNEKPVKHIEFMCSSSHTYGNAIAFIENWLINLFPENFFKTIHVNSKIAHRQITSTPHHFNKKAKPIFAISPRIDYDDSRFLEGTPLIQKMSNYRSTFGMGSLMPFFADNEKKFCIDYQMNRAVMYADVIIILSTRMQQLNMMDYIKNKIAFEHPTDIRTCLESFLAPSLVDSISQIAGIPIVGEDGTTNKFLNYLNTHSMYPITYRLQGGTKTREFYRYYPVKIDTLLNSLNGSDGDKTGHVATSYQITFTVRMEYFTTGFYYLFSHELYDLRPTEEFDDKDIITPIYTDIISPEDLNIPGWNLFTNVSFQLEKKDDEIDLNDVLNVSIKEAINYHVKNGLPFIDLIMIRVRKQGRALKEGEDFIIDYPNMKVKFNDKDFSFYTFTMYIYINLDYINSLIKELFEVKE